MSTSRASPKRASTNETPTRNGGRRRRRTHSNNNNNNIFLDENGEYPVASSMSITESFSYFDDLRLMAAAHVALELDPSTGSSASMATNQIKTVRNSKDSAVTEVVMNPLGGIDDNGDGGGNEITFRLGNVAAFLPLLASEDGNGRIEPDRLDAVKTVIMAAHHFNSNPKAHSISSLRPPTCDVRLVVDFFDTRNSPLRVASILSRQLIPLYHDRSPTIGHDTRNPDLAAAAARIKKPMAILGPERSSVSAHIATLGAVYSIPQISHLSTSSTLDDRNIFPMFGRTVPSVDADARATVDYLRHLTWNNISHFAILSVLDDYGTSYRQSLESISREYNITTQSTYFADSAAGSDSSRSTSPTSRIRQEIRRAIKSIARSGFRYVVAIIHHEHFVDVMEEAHLSGIIGPGYVWLTTGSVRLEDVQSLVKDAIMRQNQDEQYGMAHNCSNITEAIQGLGHVAANVDHDSATKNYEAFLEEWTRTEQEDGFKSYFVSKQPQGDNEIQFSYDHKFSDLPSPSNLFLYDAVMSLGLAACSMEDRFFDGRSLFDAFLTQTSFSGVSGRLEIDPLTGTRTQESTGYTASNIIIEKDAEVCDDLANVRAAAIYRTGFPTQDKRINDEATTNQLPTTRQWVDVDGVQFEFSGRSTYAPPALPPLEIELNLINKPVKIFGNVLAAIVILSSVYFAWWTWKHWHSRVVRSSQPLFLMLVCLGTSIMGWSIAPLGFEEPPLSRWVVSLSCMAGWWLYSMGFVILMSALFAKTWRINMIMQQEAFRRVIVEPKHVLMPGIVLMSANLIALTAWSILSPTQYERSFEGSRKFDRFGRPTSSEGICFTPEGNISSLFFLAPLFLINGSVVLLASYQAFRARKIATEFSESLYIGLAMMNLLQTLLIGAPVLATASSEDPNANYLVRTFNVVSSSGVILFLIFVPKLHYHKKFCELQRLMQLSRAQRRVSYLEFRRHMGWADEPEEAHPEGHVQFEINEEPTQY